MIENGKLADLRVLDLALNDLGKPAVRKLAEGPFDKLERLTLRDAMRGDMAPLFAAGWLPAGDGYDNTYERRLELSGKAVPIDKSRAKKQPAEVAARELDDKTLYTYGEHVRHPEYGVGVVSSLGTVYFEVKFPKRGTLWFPYTPASAVPYDPKRRYVARDVIVHPQFGAGVVVEAKADRIDIAFGRNNTRTLVHAR